MDNLLVSIMIWK